MINYYDHDYIKEWLDKFEWDAIKADFNFDSGVVILTLKALNPELLQEQAGQDLIALGEGPTEENLI